MCYKRECFRKWMYISYSGYVVQVSLATPVLKLKRRSSSGKAGQPFEDKNRVGSPFNMTAVIEAHRLSFKRCLPRSLRCLSSSGSCASA